MLPLKIGIGVFAAVAVAWGAETPAISVCEALTHPKLYDHKLVAIRGIQVAGMEGGWLKGQNCDKAFVTNGYIWPSIVWLEMSDSTREAAGILGPELKSSLERGNADLKKKNFNNDRDRLVITYIGIFEAYDDTLQQYHPDSRSTRANGFGHLNSSPAQIIVTDVKDAVIEKTPNSHSKKK